MNLNEINHAIARLQEQVAALSAEADIRRIVARYMFLCDVPMPESGAASIAERIKAIVDLHTDGAVWEGVGEYCTNQFGRRVGKADLVKHFEGFFQPREPEMILNCHYLTSEKTAEAMQTDLEKFIAEKHKK